MPAERFFDYVGDFVVSPNAYNGVDFGNLFLKLFPVPLGKTARNDQAFELSGLFKLGKLENGVNALLFGRFDKSAGVDNYDLRLLLIGGYFIALVLEL